MSQARWRGVALGAMLLAAGWLAFFGDKTPPGTLAAVARDSQVPAAAPAGAGGRPAPAAASSPVPHIGRVLPRETLITARADGPRVDLFTARSWAPPPPPPMAAVPEVPQAPPLPFQVLGKKREGPRWEVYLSREGQTFIVHEGSFIDDTYKVDRIAPPTISIVHVPLGQTQTLDIGDFE